MNKAIRWMMAHIPLIEVAARLYAENHEAVKQKLKKSAQTGTAGQTIQVHPMLRADLKEVLQQLGIRTGDIVLVHSSMQGLHNLKVAPAEIINLLLETVGDTGTIVFPVFPKYDPKDCQKIAGKNYFRYRRGKMPCWTGILPFIFYRRPEVRVSSIPFNTLAAIGAHATEMMQDHCENGLAHGKGSAWDYCVNKHAKVLYLGLCVVEADTLLHVVEDRMDTKWPIPNWYTEQHYLVETESSEIPITLRVRDGKWHRYFASYYSGRILEKAKLKNEITRSGMNFGVIEDANKFVEFILERARRGKTFYFPFWKK